MHLVNITHINTIKKFSVIKINGKPTQMEITRSLAIAQACKYESLPGKVSCRSHLIRLAITLYLYSILNKTSQLNKLEAQVIYFMYK